MNSIMIRFYAQLNDFLPESIRYTTFKHRFNGSPAVKDVIESLGVPHPEVALIVIDNEIRWFPHRLSGGEVVSVYPVFYSITVENESGIRSFRPDNIRFVVDTHLGKLAHYLRMAGFDTLYANNFDDEQIEGLSVRENRIILTRDIGLLKRSKVVYGYWVRSLVPFEQMQEVVQRYLLAELYRPFTRCLVCNELVSPVSKQVILPRLPQKVKEYCEEFTICGKCDRIYWLGSHHEKMVCLLAEMLESPGRSS